MKTTYANRLSREEFDERYEGLSESEKEQAWIENQVDPLFDMFLRFEQAFANRAIDILDISDDVAEAAATSHENIRGGEGVQAFAYFLRRIKAYRQLRHLNFAMAAVRESDGGATGLTIDEIYEKFNKLPKGAA